MADTIATPGQQEGVTDNLTEWLTKWDLQQCEQTLRKKGIKAPNDFKLIKSTKHFEQLIKRLGDDVTFMDGLKLEQAWSSMVPKPTKPEPQIYFLGDQEKDIMTKLYERYDHLSEDINVVQKAFNEFTQSIVVCRKQINENTEKMITSVTNKKAELLQKLDAIQTENKKKFNEKLEKLQKINAVCLLSKQEFNKIAANNDISPTKKLENLQSLLAMNIDANTGNNDDEKKGDEDMNNCDNYKIIGSKCVIPNKAVLTFNEQTFNNSLNSCISVGCDDITSEWKLRQTYGATLKSDKWDTNHKGINIQINGNVIQHTSTNAWSSVYGETICIAPYVYHWQFKIKAFAIYFMFGVAQVKDGYSLQETHSNKHTYYAAQGNANKAYVYNAVAGHQGTAEYGMSRFNKIGCVLDMYLDLKNYKLSFKTGGQDTGVVINDLPKDDYRMIVSLYNKQQIELVSFDHE